jgi:alpha,alpha-trehalase
MIAAVLFDMDSVITETATVHAAAWKRVFPGAVALTGVLRQAGVRTAVFSASRNARAVLRSAGALDLFDAIMAGDEADELELPGKPDPAMLLEVARRLGVSPAHAAVFEDATAGIEAVVLGGFALVVGVDRANNGEAPHDWAGDSQFGVAARPAIRRAPACQARPATMRPRPATQMAGSLEPTTLRGVSWFCSATT